MSLLKSDLKPKVYIFSNDYNAIRNEVCNQRHSVTGGNLFGLMTTSGSAVVHVVLGPGQSCSRKPKKDSFKQDKAYATRIEKFLEKNHMLCRIGEWYSHHADSSMSSQGIQCNFPRGMSKFFVMITNLNDQGKLVVSPYVFTHSGSQGAEAQYVVLDAVNPFSKDVQILAQIEQGAGGMEFHRNDFNHDGASSNTGSSFQGDNTSPTRLRAVYPGSHEDSQIGSSPSPSYHPTPPFDCTSPQISNNPTNESEEAPTKDLILKQIHDDLKKYFDVRTVDMELTGNEDINMIFEHNFYHWMILFPKTFPLQQAKVYRAFSRDVLSTCSPLDRYYLENPLVNHVNILLSVKKKCSSGYCRKCEKINKEILTKSVSDAGLHKPDSAAGLKPDQPVPAAATELPGKLEDFITALTNEINITLATPVNFTIWVQNDGSCKIKFEHYYKDWVLQFPSAFPAQPAEVFRQRKHSVDPEKSEKAIIRDSSKRGQEEIPLVSLDLIVLAIRSNCFCQPCYTYCSSKNTKF